MKGTTGIIRTTVLVVCMGLVALFVGWKENAIPEAKAFHDKAELDAFRAGGSLPTGFNQFFAASGECNGCHGNDPNGLALVDANGTDVNVVDDWRSTMMANSARDPFWRAKVSHEVLVNPSHQVALEDKCTSCHAPQGRHEKHMLGLGPYSISEMVNSPIALDGVSCVACHMQSPDSIGLFNSGSIKFDTNNVLYGQYANNIFGAPMTSFVGYEPIYGAHVESGQFCASCHTLITSTVDLNGVPTGGDFVEQATYHEWVNSIYNDNVSCQSCHVPRINDAVVISGLYTFLAGRSPYGLHHFAGANSFMLEILKTNRAALGLTASAAQFDSTIARTDRMLQQQALLLDASMAARDADTAFIDVSLINLAGHKFPSGYPARRAFVELVVLDAFGDTLFKSGRWGSDYEVEGHDLLWEPHYDVIRSQDQVQIYEMVMGDVNGNKTTVLERAAANLKDNRLAPEGFSTSHYAYDTTMITGVPSADIDFNHDPLGVEGSGSDIVHYHVPMNGYTGLVTVEARVWYQSAPPLWMQEMFAFNSTEIDAFRSMYDQADGSPTLVREMSFTDLSVGIDDIKELGVRIFPNPVVDGLLTVNGISDAVRSIDVYDPAGKRVASRGPATNSTWQVTLPKGAATYLVVIHTTDRMFVQKVVSF